MLRSLESSPTRSLARRLALSVALTSMLAPLAQPTPTLASIGPPRHGAPGMLQPHTGSLLVDYYDAFIRDRDIDAFRRNVSARYNEGTLARVLQAGEPQARRASVLALGLFGGFGSNAAVAHALKDRDPTVRSLADNALWMIWFRADSPENNEALEKVRALVNRGRFDAAIEQADILIARVPTFAEAYNQKAIAHFFQGRFAESEADCQKALAHNPYHIGALSGMGQCQIRLGHLKDAIKTFRRASEIQPYNDNLRETIAELEAADR